MKTKASFRRFFPLSVIVLAGAVSIPELHAADLTYNTASTLTLTGDVSYDNVRIGSGGGTAATIVDATGTTSWTSGSTSTVFYVGAHSGTTSIGTLNLGISNTITATQMTIGGLEPDANASTGHSGTVTTLANGVTTINAGNMAVGTGKSNSANGGRFTLGSNATLNLYGLTGSGSRSSLVVGRWSAFNSHSGKGNVDLGAGIANLHLTELAVGKATAGTGGSGTQVTGQMTLSTNALNHLNISGTGSVVKVGYNTDGGVTSTGTLTIGNLNSTSSITSTDNSPAILIGSKGSGTANGTLNFNGGTLKITTTDAAIAGGGGTSTLNLSGGAKLIAGSNSTNWIHSLGTATIGSGGATIDTDGKTIGMSQVFTGAGGLTKAGAGTLTLSTVQGYTGATNVTGGTLAVTGTGSINSSSDITVSSGAKFAYNSSVALNKAVSLGGNTTSNRAVLGGTGPIGVAITLDNVGDVLSPGNSPGIQEYTINQTWNSFSYDWEVNDFSAVTGLTAGSDFDQITIAGTLSLTGGTGSYILNLFSLTALNESGLVPNFSETNRTWDILTTTGGITGFEIADWTINTAGFTNVEGGTWSLAESSGNLVLSYNVVPEPGTALIGGLGLLALLRRRRMA